MAKWRKQQSAPKAPEVPPVPTQEEILEDLDKALNVMAGVGPDCPTIDKDTPPEPVAPIQPGQVWEGVVVPDRPVNVLGLRPGAALPPLVIDGPFTDGTGHWSAGFEGERGTKIRVDLEMLQTGRLRQ